MKQDISPLLKDKLIEMKLYMNSSKLIDQGKSISDWYGEFMETSRNNDAMRSTWFFLKVLVYLIIYNSNCRYTVNAGFGQFY